MKFQIATFQRAFLFCAFASVVACSSDDDSQTRAELEHPPEEQIYLYANECVSLKVGEQFVVRSSDDAYTLGDEAAAEKFFMKASALGTYLFYDVDRGYLTAEDSQILRETQLESDVYRLDENYISGAEWNLEFSSTTSNQWQLHNRRNNAYFTTNSLVEMADDADALELVEAEGCTQHPEMALSATGMVERRTYDDGTLFGFADTHSHILSSTGFGGGGIFHGQAFHRLGVEHAMGSCEPFHGPDGRADFVGSSLIDDLNETDLINLLTEGLLPEPAHDTEGWPNYPGWPTYHSQTHQTQYYRWLERAWMGGLRLMVQHAVSNEVFCQLMANPGYQPVRWECGDMFNIDKQLIRIREMESYIDAQHGGPGKGWFRIVETPAEAREVIAEGKLAIVLGIEVPNLFSCYSVPRADDPECDEAYIEAQLDLYHDLGIRVLFPNHKFDNAFTPGDGHRGIIELGNFVTTSHWSNFVQDCPDIESSFDKGPVTFGGLNEPRDMYLSPPPNERVEISDEPVVDLLPYVSRIRQPPLEGDWCQKGTLTDAGRTLFTGIMKRGMIPEIDHLPRRSYIDAFAMLEEVDYPAAGTHGRDNDGKLFDLGGISKSGFQRCADPANPGSMAQRFRDRRDMIAAAGGFEAEAFGFDLNGLAGVPRPRFGDDANCTIEQQDPVAYPFTSFAGDVTFEEPTMGERVVDFNTEGMIHIGLVPELIEDARRTGVSDEDLDIIFKSAEAYIRMWERAEAQSKQFE